MKKIFLLLIFLIFIVGNANSRNIGETEIITEEGIEVFQNEKYYLLKKNVIINSDQFNLTGDFVKIFFEKDLYDIVNLFAEGNVNLNSENYGINGNGEKIKINVKSEEIEISGVNSSLILENTNMYSDGNIKVNNNDGSFFLYGKNSQLTTDNINIKGNKINGIFSNNSKEKEINELYVEDDKILNIKTDDLDMYSNRAVYNKKTSIIELFDNVKVIRGSEIITGDYGILDTTKNSYKVSSINSKKVKAIISNTNE